MRGRERERDEGVGGRGKLSLNRECIQIHTHMNEVVGASMCTGHNSERGMDLSFLWGQDNSLAIQKDDGSSEGRERDWGLGLFRRKLTGAYKLLYTVAIHKGNLCKQYNKYYGEGYSCIAFSLFQFEVYTETL